MLLGYPVSVFALGKPVFEAYCKPSIDGFLHKRHNSVICIQEWNDLLYIFIEILLEHHVVA